jgi:filamentous hemagglutinin
VGQDTLLALLPAELRPGAPVFALNAWQEQQALRQAALKETGQALFLAGLGYDVDLAKSKEW